MDAEGISFTLNGRRWVVKRVDNSDPSLTRSDGSQTLGVTDVCTNSINISKSLNGAFFELVLAHEICHAICVSYKIFLKEDEEERLCEFISHYGRVAIDTLDECLQKFGKQGLKVAQ